MVQVFCWNASCWNASIQTMEELATNGMEGGKQRDMQARFITIYDQVEQLHRNPRWTWIVSWIVSAKELLLTVPKEHQEMLKANNNYKAFYQITMEDLHDSDVPEYKRIDKKDSRNISLSVMLRHRAISLLSI
jgi:hypothetical protein